MQKAADETAVRSSMWLAEPAERRQRARPDDRDRQSRAARHRYGPPLRDPRRGCPHHLQPAAGAQCAHLRDVRAHGRDLSRGERRPCGQGHDPHRRRRQGIRLGHRHFAVPRLQGTGGRARVRGPHRPGAGRPRALPGADDRRDRGRLRRRRRRNRGLLRPAHRHPDGEVRLPDRSHARQLPIDVEHQPPDGPDWPRPRQGHHLHGPHGRSQGGPRARSPDRGGRGCGRAAGPRRRACPHHCRPRPADAARHQGSGAAPDQAPVARGGRGPDPDVLHEPGFPRGDGGLPQQAPAALARGVAAAAIETPHHRHHDEDAGTKTRAASGLHHRRQDQDRETGNSEETMGPLAGLKVIDLTHVMAGPTCTMMLADMGADVIKIEKVPHGDDTRRSVPPKIGTEAASFLIMNRNKRGMVLDIKTPGGAEILKRLATSADVLVENFGPGVMDRLGFGYEALSRDNPGLIYCSLSGFGRTGPYKHRRGFDLVAQAMSGIMTFTGEAGGPPTKCGPPLSDITAGILGAMGILAAYAHRLKTGQGQWVETSLFEAALVQTYWQSAIALATGEAPRAMGSAHPLNAPYQAFEAADGWMVIGGANQTNWLRVVDALGAPELAEDPRFKDNAARMAHLPYLEEELAVRFRPKPVQHWLDALETRGVPCGPVQDMLQALADPQTLAREMVVEVPHTALGPVKTLGLPVKFSETPGKVRTGAPLYGEHTRAILAEYGYSPHEIERLVTEGAVVALPA